MMGSASFPLQLPHSSLHPKEFQEWVESAVLEGARQLETLCQSVEEALNAPAAQVELEWNNSVLVTGFLTESNGFI